MIPLTGISLSSSLSRIGMTMAAMVVKQMGGTITIGCTADRRIQHAQGTEYNGFLLFEADEINSFLDQWSSFKDKTRWYVEKTHTIVQEDERKRFRQPFS